MIIKSCLKCKKEFRCYPCEIKIGWGLFCSPKCHNLSQKGQHHSRRTELIKGHKMTPRTGITKSCRICQKDFYVPKSLIEKKSYCSRECVREAQISGVIPNTGFQKRDGVHITPINNLIRRTSKYKRWRTSVFERDSYTCQKCEVRGFKLNADHIKPFSIFPDLRFDLNNGRTLCISCHRGTDTYGFRYDLTPSL